MSQYNYWFLSECQPYLIETMFPGDTVYSFAVIWQVCIGVLANSWLFLIYACTFLIQPHLRKPIHSIFMHLTMANILTIVFQSIPRIMSSFRVKHFLDNIGCQTFLYLYRIARGLSICTTSLLSVFQAITVSHSKWAWLKSQLSKRILPSLLCFWVINMLIYTSIIVTVRARANYTVVGTRFVHAYCQTETFQDGITGLFESVIVIHDVLFMVPMIGSSLYVVFILYRHRRRARHIHSLAHSSESSAENKATRTILLLVLCFVLFYVANNFVTFYALYSHEKNARLVGITGLLSSCYPAFCPFLLMKNNKIISKMTSSIAMMKITFSPRPFGG